MGLVTADKNPFLYIHPQDTRQFGQDEQIYRFKESDLFLSDKVCKILILKSIVTKNREFNLFLIDKELKDIDFPSNCQ